MLTFRQTPAALTPTVLFASALSAAAVVVALSAAPAMAQDPVDEDAPATEAVYPAPDLDMAVRIPVTPEDGASWLPPTWALQSESSIALEKKGSQILAMIEEVDRTFQPRLTADNADVMGPALAEGFLSDTYAGPELGQITWDGFSVLTGTALGSVLRGTAEVELPGREDETGRLVLDFVPVRGGLNAIALVGVATAEEALAAADELQAFTATYDGPVKDADLPSGHVVEDAGYELDLPDGLRTLTERERLALNGEPVGGNSGFGGALAYQQFFDPGTLDGKRSFGCVAYSTDNTLEVVDPAKAPRLGDNYRVTAAVMLKNGSYMVDGGKAIRGRPADLFDSRPIVVDPKKPGTLTTVDIGDRDAYLWRTEGIRQGSSTEDEPVQVATFYTAWSDVNLHCQAAATADQSDLLNDFEQAMRSLTVSAGEDHHMDLGLMARYKRWWPYTNPLLQLFWAPIPIILFAGWLANRGD